MTTLSLRIAAAAFIVGFALPAFAQTTAPRACDATTVVTGGTAVTAISGKTNGYYIQNPLSTTDEGVTPVEPLYVDPTKAATTTGSGTNSAIAAGQAYSGIGLSSVNVSVNAATSGHAFVCVRW